MSDKNKDILLAEILNITEKRDGSNSSTIIKYLKSYIIYLSIKMEKMRRYYIINTLLSLTLFAILIFLFIVTRSNK
jgi:hypothetical protein